MRIIVFILLLTLPALQVLAQAENSAVRKGNNHYEDGKYKEAEIDYRKALDKAPTSIKGSYNLANALYKQDNFEDASKNYLNTISQIPVAQKEQQAAAYHNLGNSMLKSKKYPEAIDAYKQSLRLNPGDNDTRYNLSYAMNQLQQQQNNQQSKSDKNDNNDKKDKQEQKSQPDDQKQQQDDNKDQQQKPEISKKDAERMLQALNNDEQKTLDKVNKQKVKQVQARVEKDW